MSAPAHGWEQARRILCVRLDNLGDVLMTTPALRALKAARPDRQLILLGSRAGCAAAAHIPELDGCIPYAASWVKQAGGGDAASDLEMVRHLRDQHFDAAVIFTVYTQSALPAALLCRMAGIPLRLAHCRENPYGLLSDWVAETEPRPQLRHEVRRQLDLVAAVGAHAADERLSFAVSGADHWGARLALRRLGVDPAQPWLLVHPGATAPSRRYPPELFRDALRLVHQRHRLPLVFGGTAAEAGMIEEVRRALGFPSHSLAGELTLGECAAVIGLASVLLSNNSGPVHLAAALGTPVVDLYALTNPQHTPWQVPGRVLFHDVPCRFCLKSVCPEGHQLCLRGVAPQQVAEAVGELLGEGAAPSLPALPLPAHVMGLRA